MPLLWQEFEEALEKIGKLEQGVSARELLKVKLLIANKWSVAS